MICQRAAPITALLLVAGCGGGQDTADAPPGGTTAPASPRPAAHAKAGARWELQSSGEGVALALMGTQGGTTIRLFCPAGQRGLLVNIPAFRAVASEERLSFGSGGEAVALVADPRGDAERGGV